jgi:hypothetical protein
MPLDFNNSPHAVTLNFLPLQPPLPEVPLFYRAANEGDQRPDERTYQHFVPGGHAGAKDVRLWISFAAREGFSPFNGIELWKFQTLARHFLEETLRDVCAHLHLPLFDMNGKGVMKAAVEIPFEQFAEGVRTMSVRAEYMFQTDQFGFCFREEFRRKQGIPFNRSVLMRSGALDSGGRPNSQYHVEAWERLKGFLESRRTNPAFGLMRHSASAVGFTVSEKLLVVPAPLLNKRRYLFAGSKEGDSQYLGVRDFGPFETPTDGAHYLAYVALERDRPVARTLYNALHQGTRQPDFDGLDKLFRIKFKLHPDAKFIGLQDFSQHSIDTLVTSLGTLKDKGKTIAMIVLPKAEEEAYCRLKSTLLSQGIISQFCTRELATATTSLKWAAANIALGVFAKSGGSPWHIKSDAKRAVIIGVAQSVEKHREADGSLRTIRHIAYSVLTDSTGEFRKMDQLADVEGGDDKLDEYSGALAANLAKVLRAEAQLTTLVVLHCPFTIKRSVLAKIREATETVAVEYAGRCNFCVVKLNQPEEHSWFGFFSSANSLVPLESSVVTLGAGEYLIWFDGLDPQRRLAKKRYSGPTHVRFLGEHPDHMTTEKVLQDLVDLAGANWRGFNARSEPVSVYYCKLVAKFIKKFRRFEIPIPPLDSLNPWFL